MREFGIKFRFRARNSYLTRYWLKGYSKEEVETILKETGVTYQFIEDFFVE